MKKLIVTTLLILTWATLAANDNSYKYSNKKTFKKSYTASANTVLSIENKYGNITFRESSGKTITINVEVLVEANKRSEVEHTLNYINVSFGQSLNKITARTTIESNSANTGRIIKINYDVAIPKSLALELKNSYGDVTIGNHNGTITANLAYGDLNAMELTQKSSINIRYGNVEISGRAKALDLGIEYGDCDINSVGTLTLASKYSKFFIKSLDKIDIKETKYDKYTLGEIDSFEVSAISYCKISIEQINTVLRIGEAKYCTLNATLNSSFTKCDIGSKYTNINLKVDRDDNFSYALSTRYGNVTAPFPKNNTKTNNSSSSYLEGNYGTTTASQANMKITSEYGNIVIQSI